MKETLEPIRDKKEIKKNKHISVYICPMCGEYLSQPSYNYLLSDKPTITTCRYCETKIDWEFLSSEIKEKKVKKETTNEL